MNENMPTIAETEFFEIWDNKDNSLIMIHFVANNVTIGMDYEEFEELKECLKQTDDYNWERPSCDNN